MIEARYIEQYLYATKGVKITIIPPENERQELLFIQALQYALVYFNLIPK